MKPHLLLAAAGALALTACGDNDTAATDAAAGTGATAAATPSPTAMAAQAFVDTAAASDMYEVEAGKLAQEMGTSQAVKDFGAMMETDHTKSSSDLKAAAAQASGVAVNPQLTTRQQSDLEALRNAGDTFDSRYKLQQVAAHEAALSLLQTYAAGGDAASLKDFAGKTAPVVEGHLAKARELP